MSAVEASRAGGGWAAVDRLLGEAGKGLDPQELRVTRLTAAFSLALCAWGPLYAALYALLGAYQLAIFVVIAVLCVGGALFSLRRGRRALAGHQLLTGLLGVLLAIGAYTRGVFSPTLMWLPVLPVVALLLLGRKAALLWGAIALVAICVFTAAAFTGNEGEGVFSGGRLIAYHSVSLLSTVALQASLALLFESAKVRMGEELAAQRDVATRAHDDARRLLDNVGQALFVVNASGAVGPSPSATALEWFGPNDGRPAAEWLAEDEPTRNKLAAHLVAFEGGTLHFERAARWIGVRLVPIGKTGTALVICTDLTEARRVESAEVSRRLLSDQLVRAEERSRMKSDFLASTSHELRTPLNTIINIPQGILESLTAPRVVRCTGCGETFELEENEAVPATCPTCSAPLELLPTQALAPAVTARLLGSVVTSGKHLLTVVNDILDYSRLEAGGQLLVRERTGVSEILDQLEGVIAPVAQRAGVGLLLQRDTAPETQLSVDRVKLAQVLINLVSNAIKFSNGQGEVKVLASTFDEAGQAWVLLEVKDRGIGIAPENLKLIFEGFRQVDHGPNRRYGGTGLGLAISKRLVELHGGSLEVHSRLGEGSTFRVRLPVSAPQREPEGDAVGPLVLLIDDDAGAAESAALLLNPLGFRVVGLRDPTKALQRVRELRPEVVMLDVMMPRFSGFDVLKQLLADPIAPTLRVLVTSAYPDNRSVAEALGVKFISKPWAHDELKAFVQLQPKRGAS